MAKIYLAGKIYKNCWRHEIVPDLKMISEKTSNIQYLRLKTINSMFKTVGPFFISSEHGIYHSDRFLHALAGKPWQYNSSPVTNAAYVKKICLYQIEETDYVFCYIHEDDIRPYGTIFELGFAYGLRKKIILCFSSLDAMCAYKDILYLADHVFIEEWPRIGFEYLCHCVEKGIWPEESTVSINGIDVNVHFLSIFTDYNHLVEVDSNNFFDILTTIEDLMCEREGRIGLVVVGELSYDLWDELIETVDAYSDRLRLESSSMIQFALLAMRRPCS